MGVFVLVQNVLCVKDYVEELRRRVPSSSVIDGFSIPSVPKSPPILSEKWLVIVRVGGKIKRDLAGLAGIVDRANVVVVTGLGDGSVQSHLLEMGIEFSVRDNRIVSFGELCRWVSVQLGVGMILAKYIVKASGSFEPTVVKNVEMLRVVDKKLLTVQRVRKYLPAKRVVGFGYFYKYLVFGQGKYEDVVVLVRQYQFSLVTLVKYVVDRLNFDIRVYEMIMDSELSSDNCLAVSESLRKPVGVLLECLRMFESVSMERLFSLKVLIWSLRRKTPAEFLYKVRGVVSERKV